jgi:addiction module RelE/StbE family toxin
MVRIIWTARSITDLEDIADFISKNSKKYAKLTIEKLIGTAKFIEKNQHIVRIVPKLNQQDIREIITGNYRIIYQNINENNSNILTVHHCARLLQKNPALK